MKLISIWSDGFVTCNIYETHNDGFGDIRYRPYFQGNPGPEWPNLLALEAWLASRGYMLQG